jgi:hypothetical protein
MKTGVIERVVENWLTSANERQYQIPFCQVLAAEGEKIIYISPHGPRELGKDVITIAADKVPCAYQLKGGRVNLNEWRKYKGEVDELVEYPIDHPSVRSHKPHRSYFVTNGTVADPVLDSIRVANVGWKRRGVKPLRLVARDELVARFVAAHGSFLPRETRDFSSFLELIVNGGRGPFDKEQFASFLESVLPIKGPRGVAPRDAGRSISSAILLTSYIIQGCEREENHWAVFSAWTVVAAYIFCVASKHRTPAKWWSKSFELCEIGGIRALEALAAECSQNKTLFTQGDPFTDGPIYRLRITVLAGLLSVLGLYHSLKGEEWKHDSFLQEFLTTNLDRAEIWGESASPYIIMSALALEQHGAHRQSEQLAVRLMQTIVELNSSKGRGIPNPYYEPEDAFRLQTGLDAVNREIFAGHSYTLETIVEFMARRLLRQTLAHFWEKITRLRFTWFQPGQEWEWFRWKSETGSLKQTMPNMPQSWRALLDAAENGLEEIPALLKERPTFALFFALVYPQRLGVGLMRLIDRAVRKT